MTLAVGERLPDATLAHMGENGPELVQLADVLKGRKVVVFGLPGAYTGPCSTIHIPSFVRTADEFRARGVDEIVCISVNDPFVLKAWGESTGATAAGITLLGDADAVLTKALGMDFTAPPLGLYNRSNRYALLVEDGVITVSNVDEPATCKISVGEELLAAM
ncbi:peroxiredoxin [Palleronia sp. KMU-117]|uniref:peroxiredoxin n=1 Tax=Palleronia sp. KMU-117 TaxID=3434108 RepID=UPI003D7364B6